MIGVIGMDGVGKTNLINRIRNIKFNPIYNPTQHIEIIDNFIEVGGTIDNTYSYKDWHNILSKCESVLIVFTTRTYKYSQKYINLCKRFEVPYKLIYNKYDIQPKIDPNVNYISISCKNDTSEDIRMMLSNY